MLLAAMRKECAVLNAPEGDAKARVVGGNNAMAAAIALSRILTPATPIPFGDESFLSSSSDKDQQHGWLVQYAQYLEASADLYLHLAMHGGVAGADAEEAASGGMTAAAFLERVPESRVMTVFVWSLLAKHSFALGRFSEAATRLRRAARWGVGSLGASRGDPWVSDSVSSILAQSTEVSNALAASTQSIAAPCSLLYWLTHALAADEEDVEDTKTSAWTTKGGLDNTSKLLQAFLSCRDAPSAFYQSPKSPREADALRARAKELLAAIDSLSLREAE